MGPQLMGEYRRQAERFGAEFLADDVTRVDFSERPFRVWVGDDEYRAESVIVATGATARQVGLASERALHGRGVTYCAVCDAAFYRDKEVVVVGGGDSAMEEAIFLTKFASKVTVLHRRHEFRASPIMFDRARDNDKIEFVTPVVVEEALGAEDGKLTGVRIRNLETDEVSEIPADGLFVALGHDPTEDELREALPARVHDRAREQLLEPARHDDEPRPRLEGHDHYVFGVFLLPIAVREEDRVFYQEIDIIATRERVVTVRKTPERGYPCDLAPAQLTIKQEADDRGGMILYRIVDLIAEDFLDLVDALNEEIDELEEGLETWTSTQVRGRISDLRHDLLHVRRTLAPTRDP